MKLKRPINYKKIKRLILKRDTGLDTRFTTKVKQNKKIYNRKKNNKNNLDN
jgi:hypothetical protein